MDPEADALFGLPPGEFTAARDALAARLRAEGRRDEAVAVRSLRRPTTAAAALNRTVRAHRDAVDELLAAGRNLARAQERLVAGKGDRAVLREAAEHVRDAISALTALATAEEGLSVASADRVRATLHAALLDEGVREALAAGRLQREAEAGAAGFPAASGAVIAAPRPGRKGAPDPAQRARAAARLEAATEAVRDTERRLAEAQARAGQLAEAAEDLRTRLAAAEEEERSAAGAVEELRAELRAAKSEEAAALRDAE